MTCKASESTSIAKKFNENIITKRRTVALNGKVLELSGDVNLPDLTPMRQDASSMLELSAVSFGYYVFKDAKAKACMNSSQ